MLNVGNHLGLLKYKMGNVKYITLILSLFPKPQPMSRLGAKDNNVDESIWLMLSFFKPKQIGQ
jgi:hypothetical protein